MTILVRQDDFNGADAEYTIEANGQDTVKVFVHTSKGKIEVQLPQLARVEPHTVVIAPSYVGVESRDPEPVTPT